MARGESAVTPATENLREQLEVFELGRDTLVAAGVPYVVGGGLAVGCYGQKRPTKDIDFFIPYDCAEEAIEALHEAGFRIKRSDPVWLYQSWKGETLVDLVFRINTTQGRIPIEGGVIERGSERTILGAPFRVISPEDLIIFKVLVQHENRPDWWDATSILLNRELDLDWQGILRYADIDPVKVLSFLLFVSSRHPSETLFPGWVLESMWQATAKRLSLLSIPAAEL